MGPHLAALKGINASQDKQQQFLKNSYQLIGYDGHR
jgi:hypothetical protein